MIDEKGNNLGVLNTEEALRLSQGKNLDLIEIAPTANPPVVRFMEFGKFLYQEQKKQKAGRKVQKNEIKEVRFTIRTSDHDIELRASQVDKFLKKRYKVKILLIMKGREKSLSTFANTRLQYFLGLIKEAYKVEMEPKRFPLGIWLGISHG